MIILCFFYLSLKISQQNFLFSFHQIPKFFYVLMILFVCDISCLGKFLFNDFLALAGVAVEIIKNATSLSNKIFSFFCIKN